MKRLEHRVVILTGAGCRAAADEAPGNGQASALLFAREGARLLLVDRDPVALDATLAALNREGLHAESCLADVSIDDEVTRLVETCLQQYGRIDVLLHNVGISNGPGLLESTLAQWDRCFSVNVRSAFLLARAVVPSMRQQRSGRIIHVSSIAGRRANPRPAHAYASSKAALDMFSKTLAAEFAGDGIRCNTVVPGMIDTPMVRHSMAAAGMSAQQIGEARELRQRRSPTAAQGSAWDIAQAALFLASGECAYLNGAELVVDGGLTNLMP